MSANRPNASLSEASPGDDETSGGRAGGGGAGLRFAPPGAFGPSLAPSSGAAAIKNYRFRLSASWFSSSAVVITRELAWKPRWKVSRFVNS